MEVLERSKRRKRKEERGEQHRAKPPTGERIGLGFMNFLGEKQDFQNK